MNATSELPVWLAGLYPFRPKSFTTPGGARMSYLDEGRDHGDGGDAVLMLHGNPTWSFYYRELVQALAPVRRCIVPDHIGMGLSDKPQDYSYTLATRITDIAALVTHLGLRRVHLVVHDWGGAIGFGFAAKHPEMIGRIVILNTAAFSASRIPLRISACKLPVIGPLVVRGANGFAGPAVWMAMHRRKLSLEERSGFLFPYRSWASRVAVSAFVQDIPLDHQHPSWETLRGVEAGLEQFRDRPVLIVWGGKDFCFDDYFLERWRWYLPHARINRIADAGHYVLADAREDAVPCVANFLAPS